MPLRKSQNKRMGFRMTEKNSWYESIAELAAVYGEMCEINKTKPDDQTSEQIARLKVLRAECVALHYKRIAINQNAQGKDEFQIVGYLDGLDKNAEFMSLELKADHDKRNSSTPKRYTIPVYASKSEHSSLGCRWVGLPYQMLQEIVQNHCLNVEDWAQNGLSVANSVQTKLRDENIHLVHGCEYFVLPITNNKHAAAALVAYAESCANDHPELSASLIDRFADARIPPPPVTDDEAKFLIDLVPRYFGEKDQDYTLRVFRMARGEPESVWGTRKKQPNPLAGMVEDMKKKREKLIAAGKCPECEGEGEFGGQFCGGDYFDCGACKGTGKYTP